MDTLFSHVSIVTMDDRMSVWTDSFLGVTDGKISYLGKKAPEEQPQTIIDGSGMVLMPGLINCHTHLPMTILRGYADDLKLQEWLNDYIFPREAHLDDRAVKAAAQLAIAECLRFGVTSVSDMYDHCDAICQAVAESGIKANISRGMTMFLGDEFDFEKFPACQELVALRDKWQGYDNGRIKIEASVHAEYTSTYQLWDALAEFSINEKLGMQVHLSETKREHDECVEKYGLTPAQLLDCHHLFDVPTVAAHCVWLEDEDFDILKKHNVSVACCPASNLKLASGYANIPKMLEKGINIALGTDGAASNNNLNILQDIYLFGVVYKGFYHDSTLLTPAQVLHTATRAGALSQGRTDCGKLAVGYKADLCVIDTDTPQFTPMTDAACNVVYAAQGADVRLTMVDGEVLYRDGEFKTIDIEKVKAETQKRTDAILRRL